MLYLGSGSRGGRGVSAAEVAADDGPARGGGGGCGQLRRGRAGRRSGSCQRTDSAHHSHAPRCRVRFIFLRYGNISRQE